MWHIACVGGRLLAASHSDDFLLASPEALKTSSANFLELILLATGWTFARNGDKATDMSCTVQALGALICLEGVPRGIVEIKNNESQISELVNSFGQCLEASRLDGGTAEKPRGRLGFAENHVFGRAGLLALKGIDAAHTCSQVRVRAVVFCVPCPPTLPGEAAGTKRPIDRTTFCMPSPMPSMSHLRCQDPEGWRRRNLVQ